MRHGDRFIATSSANTIRWGILITGYQSAPIYHFLLAFLDDARREVIFSWQSSENLEQQKLHFNNLVQAALTYLAPTIIGKVATQLQHGHDVHVGTCLLRKDGVTFMTQGWILTKTHVLPWRRVGTDVEQGQLVVFDRAEPSVRTAMPLRETENAIVIKFLSEPGNWPAP